MGVIIRLLLAFFVLCLFRCASQNMNDETATQKTESFNFASTKTQSCPSHSLPKYAIYLDQPIHQRYNKVIQDKKHLLTSFIDYLYGLDKFKYSMWIAKAIFHIIPKFMIRNYLGSEFYDECQGIAQHSGRQVYEIVVYNYMYQIGSANDFCTSIALTQFQSDSQQNNQIGQKQNLNILARNLDYGFQKFLGENTIRLDFYNDIKSTRPFFTTLAHAGFVSSHTVLKYQSSQNLQFGMSLNQRKSGSYLATIQRILFSRCESVFQLTNRILKSQISTTDQLIKIVSQSKSCSNFYFIIQTKTGDNLLIEKNYGLGVHKIYLKNSTNRQEGENPSYILQTNTDMDQLDRDGRRDQAVNKIKAIIQQQGYIQQNNIRQVLLEQPNFNELTIMTAIMNIENGSIDAVVWQNSQNLKNWHSQNDLEN